MNKTPNYQLSQWDPDDKIQMADFNADNTKIDVALGALMKNQLQLVTGSYVGTGEYGWEHPNTLTFPFPPTIVCIVADHSDISSSGTIFIRGQRGSSGIGIALNESLRLGVSWKDNSVSWSTSSSVKNQLNVQGFAYTYFALG